MLSVVWGRRRDLERNFWEEEGTGELLVSEREGGGMRGKHTV